MFFVLASRYHTYASGGGGIKWVLVQCGEICKCRSSGQANCGFRPHAQTRMLPNIDSSEEVLSKGRTEMTALTLVAIMRSREDSAELGYHHIQLRPITAEGLGVDSTNFCLLVVHRGLHLAHPLRNGKWSSFSGLSWKQPTSNRDWMDISHTPIAVVG